MKRIIKSSKDLADFQAAVRNRINYLENENVNSATIINAAEDEDEDENYYREQYTKNRNKFTHIYSDNDIANYILNHWSLDASEKDDVETIIGEWIDQAHDKYSSLNDSFTVLNDYVNDDLLDALNILRRAADENTECFPECIYPISQQEELYRMWYYTHVVK